MIRNSYVMMVLVVLFLSSGCASNRTRIGEGATAGGVLGATAGAIIGYQSGHPYQGALIGGAVGAGGGAVVGSQIDKHDQ